MEEYLSYKAQIFERAEGKPMPEDEREFEKVQFRILDADHSGTIDYWEFLKHEAVKLLGRRSQVRCLGFLFCRSLVDMEKVKVFSCLQNELVQLLTPSEVVSARQVYDHMDKDKDGRVSEMEARLIYHSWYSFLEYITEDGERNSCR